jgi:hypothetical protein
MSLQDETRGALTCIAWLMGGFLALGSLKGRIQINQDLDIKVSEAAR